MKGRDHVIRCSLTTTNGNFVLAAVSKQKRKIFVRFYKAKKPGCSFLEVTSPALNLVKIVLDTLKYINFNFKRISK